MRYKHTFYDNIALAPTGNMRGKKLVEEDQQYYDYDSEYDEDEEEQPPSPRKKVVVPSRDPVDELYSFPVFMKGGRHTFLVRTVSPSG